MMNLKEVNEALSHKIVSGSDYGWNCFPDAKFLDYESDYAHASIIYSTKTQEIFQAEICIKLDAWDEDKKPYRWLNPEHKDNFYKEASDRNVDPDQAWDDVKWVDLDFKNDWLEKATSIFAGEEFDTRVQMEVDLEDDLFLQLAKEAHKRDITLNNMIEIVLREAIDHHHVNGSLD